MTGIVSVVECLKHGEDGKPVVVQGWIKSKRVSKSFAFLVINDGSCQADLQVVVDADSNGFAALGACQTGASVRVVGTLKASPGKGQAYEVLGEEIEVIGEADPSSYPLQKKGHTLEFLREKAHLRCRSNTFGAVFRLRHRMAKAIHDFFDANGFYWVHTPLITASDCEGAGEMFRVSSTLDTDQKCFFGKPAHLTVSGQLNAEALALGLGKVYTFGPTFRAENSNTSRHLSEFWMVEPEVAFSDLAANVSLAENFLKSVISSVLSTCSDELSFFEKLYKKTSLARLQSIAESSFHRLTYSDAIVELEKAPKNFEFPVSWGRDLQSEHERYLCEEVCKGPVVVTDYPKDIKAFYMRLNDDGKTVAAMDILAPGIGEIIGGSQREDRLEMLDQRLDEMNIDHKELWWYRELRMYGSTPHAGFGLGFERLLQYVSGMENIRDVVPFPRAPGLIEF